MPDEHLWSDTNISLDVCYVGEKDCLVSFKLFELPRWHIKDFKFYLKGLQDLSVLHKTLCFAEKGDSVNVPSLWSSCSFILHREIFRGI